MKRIITALLLLMSVSCWAQDQTIGNRHNKVTANGRLDADSGTYSKGIPTLTVKDSSTFVTPYYFSSHAAAIDSVGGTITGTPTVGQIISKGSPSDFIRAVYYPTQVPTASLSGGSAIEKHSAGTFTGTLIWGAGRQAATQPLSSIVVATVGQTFSQPAAPGTVSGTQMVTVTYNTNVTYTNTVTTTDSKTASASTTYSFSNSRYWGTCSASPAINSDLLSNNHELSAARAKTSFSITVSGTNQYIYYAYPSSFGNLTSFVVGGFESLPAFTLTTATVTNASGFAETFNIYTSNNTFSSTTVSGIITN